LFAYK